MIIIMMIIRHAIWDDDKHKHDACTRQRIQSSGVINEWMNGCMNEWLNERLGEEMMIIWEKRRSKYIC
jgi:hypothetical protein